MTRLLCFLFHDVYVRDPAESGFRGRAADRYKLPVVRFERQLSGLARARQDAPLLIDGTMPRMGGRMPFAITVDDGGVSFYTHVADRLEALGWRGHCFMTTGCIGRPGFLDRGQIRELRRRGHVIGSHSVSHPTRFSTLSWEEMVREWADSREALRDVLGDDVTVGSVPGGYYASRVAAAASEAGFQFLFTSEPETTVRTFNGCSVLGRFTVRRDCYPDFAARIGRRQRSTLLLEWMVWNGKKVAKKVLGAAYPRLSAAPIGWGRQR